MKINLAIVLCILLFSCQVEIGTSEEIQSSEGAGNVSQPIDPERVDINLKANNVILWNEIQIDTSDLHDSISTLIIRSITTGAKQLELDSLGLFNKTNYLIYLHTEKKTSYDFYTRFGDIVNNAIERIREEKSQLIYQESYKELSSANQSNIKQLVEQCIVEIVSSE
jgi:hypothetical protein